MFNPFKKTQKDGAGGKARERVKRMPEKKEVASIKTVKENVPSQGRYPLGILIAPRITEKATMLSQRANQYVFEVSDTSNAGQIRHAVEKKYGVRVEKVNVLHQPGKKVRLGRREGWRRGFKKAIVTVSKGQAIELT